ncbi:nitrilase-related carbon-nitrogen hydrolase [uncultured Friedmanniella sp.]|uniref:nitrilase-related carbon-nitrogen hydrolase n=1 Tax=uncultured Friedmanniella sp. TaxID=335381 RepID=UPI0035CB8D2E
MALVVAACQVPVDIDDVDRTRAAVVAAVAEAADRGAQLVVLPELTLCGAVFRDAAEAAARAEPVSGPSVELFRDLSRRHGLVLVAGFCEMSERDLPYNSAVVVDGGEVLAVYRKTHLWNSEKVHFTPGDALPPVVATRVGVVAPLICYDLTFPEVVRSVALRGAQLVASPANWPAADVANTRPPEVSTAMSSAATNHLVVVVADRVGPERGVGWVGGSVVCDVDGFRLAGPQWGAACLLVAEVDLDAALNKQISLRNHVFDDRRTDLY